MEYNTTGEIHSYGDGGIFETNKTILITGVAGLLGSRMADWFVEHTFDYRCR